MEEGKAKQTQLNSHWVIIYASLCDG